MAGKRNYEWPLATEWDAAAFLTQDKSGGVTQRVSPALVETKLEADGFPKIPSPSANEVAVYGVGGWDSVKLADANIDAAAAIGWGKISKTGAVATDVGALPYASPTVASGKLTAAAATTGGASLNVPNGVTPTSPSDGDIWQDGSRLFMQGRILAVTKGASNSFGSGSSFAVMDAANPAKGAHIQLNAAGGMDIWTLQGGSWINELTLPIDGSIQLANLAGTGTRSVSADATGKLVANATEALPVANPTATGTLTVPDVVVSNLAGGGFRPVSISSTGKLVAGSAFIDSAVLPLDVVAGGTPRNIVTTDIPANVFPLRIVRISFHYLIVATSGNSAYLSVSLGGQSRTDSTFGLGSDGSQSGKVVIDFMAASSNTLNQVATCTRRNGANLVSISEQNYKGSEFSALNFATDLALTVDLYESSSSATITVSQMVVEVR